MRSKSAFVTGAGRGLGKGFVEYLLDQGYYVFAGVRSLEAHMPSEMLEYIECDIANDDSIRKCRDTIASKIKSLDILINNAGLNKDSATNGHKELVTNLKDLQRKSLLEMFNVNAISPLLVAQQFLPLLTATPSFVINISSCRASFHDEFENPTGNYGYRASKVALNMYTFCSVRDLPKNIKTFAVHPGSVRTDMNPGGSQTPYQQAESIFSITKSWKEEYNGKFMRWDGSLYPL